MKEDLIFHELGHGLLGRGHLNTTLENGDWKSIMCGGDMINEREWNINYRGERRAYYLDELFEESTAAPDFASTQLLADTNGFKSSFKLTFNSVSEAGWKIEKTPGYTTSIVDGRLKFESVSDLPYLITAKISTNILHDFSYELTLKYPAINDPSSQYGLIFGTVPDSASAPNVVESIEYFSINNNKKLHIGNRTWYSFFTELAKDEIISKGENKLKVIKIKDKIYYFINDIYLYISEIEASKDGFHFGFMAPANGSIYLENLTVSKLASASVSEKIKNIIPIKFEVKEIKSLNQYRVLAK